MYLTKDTYEYLLNFCDDKTIINMLSVNKKFNNDNIYERVFKLRYLFLINCKKNNETWKKLFVRIVHFIEKLDEYNRRLVFSLSLNPEWLYNHIIKCRLNAPNLDGLEEII
jgi:hypothetical protein